VSAVPALQDRLVEVRIRAAWGGLVGADAARRSRPLRVTNGCLHVVVDNSPWLAELTLRSRELTTRITAQFAAVHALRFTLGRMDDAAAPSAPTKSLPSRPLTADDWREIDATVAQIRDPEANAAARRLLGAVRRSGLQRGAS
jgi:hypothetical protein